MSDVAVRVEGIGKQYRLGAAAGPGYRTFRDALAGALTRPFRRGGAGGRGEPFWALKDVSFEVRRGEVVGIIGRNGAGKSTLLKILSRITEPTEGEADIHGRVGSLLEVGTGFHPELTGRENVYLNGAILGMKRAEITRKFDEIVAFAEVEKFIDTPVKHYSSGMYMRLAFAVAAHLEPEILVVDEVLAVGDAEFQNKCLGKMGDVARSGRTVIFVSHNMAAIQRLCTHGLLLENGQVKSAGCTAHAIRDYLTGVPTGEVHFPSGPLTALSVNQVGRTLEVVARFRVGRPLVMVCLGFVISDQTGNPVCGTNPRLQGLTAFGQGASRGAVRVRIEQPKLRDGTYRMSVWLGDGHEDFCCERDCVAFDVAGMCEETPISPLVIGSAAPTCTWDFMRE
jgi:lipopolysaccharide transport system ATP-binding protein